VRLQDEAIQSNTNATYKCVQFFIFDTFLAN
jgi:hypothetical protein